MFHSISLVDKIKLEVIVIKRKKNDLPRIRKAIVNSMLKPLKTSGYKSWPCSRKILHHASFQSFPPFHFQWIFFSFKLAVQWKKIMAARIYTQKYFLQFFTIFFFSLRNINSILQNKEFIIFDNNWSLLYIIIRD